MIALIGESRKTKVFWKALDFAFEAHKDQMRKSGDPYIMHPCNVAKILAEELDITDPEILAAALLHDTIEDVKHIDSSLLRERFGPNVETLVEGCTKIAYYSGDKQTFKKLVHRKIFSGAAVKPEVMVIKLADRLHNLRTLASMPRHKRQKIADETLDIYAPLATILGLFAIKREFYNLALAYKFPRQGNKLQININKLRDSVEVQEIITAIQKGLLKENINAKVNVRTKGLWGYYDVKNRILIKEIECPQDILIVLETRNECYQALGLLNQLYPPIPRTIRDFIANPKPTGYQGLHARANINGRKYLFKIRTNEMALQAQRGLVKEWTSSTKSRSRFIQHVQEMFDILGSDDSVSYRDMIAAGGRKEMYTYTPHGDLICLPVHSIVLDFAFRVHTEIGHTCIGALIRNKRVNPDYTLKDGDVVKVIRTNKQVFFDANLQSLCQTPRARYELSKAFRKRRQVVTREIGRNILHQEMRRYGLPFDVLDKKGMDDILAYFNIESVDEMFLRVGEGRIRLRELLYEVGSGLYVGHDILQPPTGVLNTIELDTIDPVIVKTSACCKPSPLDKGLIGLLSKRGISLHRKECSLLPKITFQREDAVDVRWKYKETKIIRPQKVLIHAANRQRIFMLLSVAPEEMKILDVSKLTQKPTKTPAWEINFSVTTLYGLKQVFKYLSRSHLSFELILD